MNLTVEIPDEIAARLSAQGGEDLSRRAREAFLAEEYRRDRLTKPELCNSFSVLKPAINSTAFSRRMTSASITRRGTPSSSAAAWKEQENAPGQI